MPGPVTNRNNVTPCILLSSLFTHHLRNMKKPTIPRPPLKLVQHFRSRRHIQLQIRQYLTQTTHPLGNLVFRNDGIVHQKLEQCRHGIQRRGFGGVIASVVFHGDFHAAFYEFVVEVAGFEFADAAGGFVELTGEQVLLQELVHDFLQLRHGTAIAGSPNFLKTSGAMLSGKETHCLFDNTVSRMGVIPIGKEGGSEDFVNDGTGYEASHHGLGIRNINRQIINRIQKHLKPHLHLLIRQRIGMQTRQQPTHELPFPRPGIQPQTNRAFHHLGMILAAFHLVNAPHHLVSIGRIKVFTDRIGHANLEFGEGEHGSVHGLVGGGVVRAGTSPRMAQLVSRLAGR
mmetsp:Transcript_29333/g.53169  ORF Transcript_29333/g.53169 Transcript_29333/m.53169 type:complete len:343 (-) Transcript_29333:235-1263(-)